MIVQETGTIAIDDQLTLVPFEHCDPAAYVDLFQANLAYLAVAGEASLELDTPSATWRAVDWKLRDANSGQAQEYGIQLDGQMVGETGVVFRHEADAHYWIDHNHRHQGIATRAARAAINFAFISRGVPSVRLLISSTNRPSQRVARRLGARLEPSFSPSFEVWRVRRGQ